MSAEHRVRLRQPVPTPSASMSTNLAGGGDR